MEESRILVCTDVHLCHLKFFGWETEARLDRMVSELNTFREQSPYEKIIFLGDYSLDYWTWDVKGSYLGQGISNTDRFVREYASRLDAPHYLLPGNHEPYGEENWQKITGCSRRAVFPAGGYLVVCCDNFAGHLDPAEDDDGGYTPTDLAFVRDAMARYPGLPVILCAHWFDPEKEPDAFYDFLRTEKRIALLFCGHDHLVFAEDLGERAGHVWCCHAGHFSYSGAKENKLDVTWGFCDVVLREGGVDVRYVEPAFDGTLKGEPFRHAYREQITRFFPRRDV